MTPIADPSLDMRGRIKTYVDYSLSKIGVSDKCRETAEKYMHDVFEIPWIGDKNPRSVAAAIVYMAAVRFHESQQNIVAKSLDVHTSTIRDNVRMLRLAGRLSHYPS